MPERQVMTIWIWTSTLSARLIAAEAAEILLTVRLPDGGVYQIAQEQRGRSRVFQLVATRSTVGRNPACRGDFRQEKGPGAYQKGAF